MINRNLVLETDMHLKRGVIFVQLRVSEAGMRDGFPRPGHCQERQE